MINHLQRDHNQVTLEINKHLLPAEPGFVQWAAATTGVVRGDAVLSARTFKILHVMIASVMGQRGVWGMYLDCKRPADSQYIRLYEVMVMEEGRRGGVNRESDKAETLRDKLST